MTDDPDFPAPAPAPRPTPDDAEIAADIADAVDAHMDSAGHAALTAEHVTNEVMDMLMHYEKVNAEAVAWASYGWLHINAAGLPPLALLDDSARQDARFWAETATPAELECYSLAALDRLSGMGGALALFSSRHIKRASGALWRRMSPAEQSAFAAWINTQVSKGESAE